MLNGCHVFFSYVCYFYCDVLKMKFILLFFCAQAVKALFLLLVLSNRSGGLQVFTHVAPVLHDWWLGKQLE